MVMRPDRMPTCRLADMPIGRHAGHLPHSLLRKEGGQISADYVLLLAKEELEEVAGRHAGRSACRSIRAHDHAPLRICISLSTPMVAHVAILEQQVSVL